MDRRSRSRPPRDQCAGHLCGRRRPPRIRETCRVRRRRRLHRRAVRTSVSGKGITVSAQTSTLIEDLRTIPTFADLPSTAVDWLAAHMQARRLEPGELLVEAGSPADSMFVLFQGELHGQRDNGTIFVLSAPQVSGLLPYSRLKTYPTSMRAVSVVRA